MISNKKIINYRVLDLPKLYNLDISFVFIRHHLKKNMNLFVLQLFLRKFDLVNRPSKPFFWDSRLNKTAFINQLFSEVVNISNHP
jgi:hypothetical protein